MKEIDELLNEINLKEEDYEAFTEEAISEEELKEMKEKVFAAVAKEKQEKQELKEKLRIKKAGEVKEVEETQESEEKMIPLAAKKRRKTKKWLLSLAATLVLGSSLIAGVTSGDLGEIFSVIFGENTANIGESGLKLGISDTQQGITLNAAGVVGDKQNAIILFDLKKEGNELFQGNNIKFGNLSFEVEEDHWFKGWNPFKLYSTSSSSSSYGWSLVDEEVKESDTRTLKLEASLAQELIGKKATLTLKDIIEVEEDYWDSEVNLTDFFEQHPEQLNPETISMPEELLVHTSEEELKYEGYNEQEIKEIMESIPKRALPEGDFNLDLYPELNGNWKVDNIGFIGNRLHIRMNGTGNNDYAPSFKDALGNEVEMTYNIVTSTRGETGEDILKGYYVYDIKDLSELREMKVSSWFQKEIQKTSGTWQVTFNIDIKEQEKNIITKQTIPWGENTNLAIKEMKLSNLSLQVTYQGDEVQGFPKAVIKFKDGTDAEIHRNASSYEGDEAECVYTFQYPIDVEQVDAIIINEVEIKVE